MGLTAVMSAIAAHPVAAALIALGVILAGVVICLYRAANYTAKLSDQMSKLREKNDEVRKSEPEMIAFFADMASSAAPCALVATVAMTAEFRRESALHRGRR